MCSLKRFVISADLRARLAGRRSGSWRARAPSAARARRRAARAPARRCCPPARSPRPAARGEVGDERGRRALALRPADRQHALRAVLGQPQRGGGRDRAPPPPSAPPAGVCGSRRPASARRPRKPTAPPARARARRPAARSPAPSCERACSGVGGSSNAATAISAAGSRTVTARANELISRPAPQTPRRLPSSSEKRTHVCHQDLGHLVVLAQLEHPGRVSLRRSRGGEAPPRRAAAATALPAPARIVGQQPDRGEALLLLPHALERLVAPGRRTAARSPRTGRSSSSRSRPKISRSCSGVVKGASARYTNRHLGQSQHHDAPRRSGSRRKIVLQLVNAPW